MIYKNLTEKEFELLLKLITQWYCKNDDTNLFSNRMHNTMLKIRAHNVKVPQYLYRAYSFERIQDLEDFKRGIYKKIKHPTKDYESWTSSLAIAKRYLPGSTAILNPNAKYGIILRITKRDFIDNIKFTLEDLFGSASERNAFFKYCFNYLSTNIMDDIKSKNFSQKRIEEFQYIIPGIVRATTEKEYLLEELIHPTPLVVEEVR